MKKKLLTLGLCVVMVVAMAAPAFAAPGGYVTSGDIGPPDTAHGHYFRYGNYFLNQWGNVPVSGTRVTTWQETGDITQAWDTVYTTSGHWIIITNSRRDLALNIYRSGSQPEVNVVAYMGNYYNDCALKIETLTLACQTATYSNCGVTITNENTVPYNTYGRICRWTKNPTNWTHIA